MIFNGFFFGSRWKERFFRKEEQGAPVPEKFHLARFSTISGAPMIRK